MTGLRSGLRWPAIQPRTPADVGGLAVALSVGFAAAAQSHRLFSQPPTKLVWWWGFVLLVATVLRPVFRRLLGWALPRLDRRTALLPILFGLTVGVWWGVPTADMLWVNRDLAGPLRLLLPIAHGLIAATAAEVMLAGLIATDPNPIPTQPLAASRPRTVTALFSLVAVAFAVWYVRQESAVYFADYMFYWNQAANWSGTLTRSPLAGWDEFRNSIQQPVYTLLPAVVPSAVMTVLGDHRAVYVGTVAGVYFAGLAAAAGWFVRRTAGPNVRFACLTPAVLLVTMPFAWGPVLRGFPDIGGAALLVLATGLYLSRPRTELRWPQLVGTAALLAAMALFRRWYNFYAVAFVLVAGLDAACGMVRPLLAQRWVEAARHLRPVVAVGGLFALFLVAFALPMVVAVVRADYADAYAGYHSQSSLPVRLRSMVERIGIGYWLAAGVSLVALLFSPTARRPALFVAATTPIMALHFYRVQDMDGHHLYLMLPAVLLLPAMALTRLFGRLPVWAGGIALTLIAGVASIGMAAVLLPAGESWRLKLYPLGPTANYPPLTRSDRAEFERLLDAVSANTDHGFYLVSSSLDLHFSVFASAERSLRRPFPAAGRQRITFEVDRRDGFPIGLFRSDLVLVADPVQLHMRPAEQQTIAVPHRQFTTGTGIAHAFDELPERFHLQGGVTVRLFRRVRPIAAADFASFCEELRSAHPTRPFVYQSPVDPDELLSIPR